ncbi:MAG TPA: cytochrome c oxidase subunit 4 [Glaciibacter sp.]|nr:cytochrome c oxidase subunit 4 [Glaciibacter sp.]
MRTNARLFWVLTAFFAAIAALYAVWTAIDAADNQVEWVGTVALSLSALLSAFIAFYLGRTHAAQGGELPEDRLDANIDDGDPELGFFSPWSWWPILLAASAALLFLGLAVGIWICYFAVGIGVISLAGWTFEYYRGLFAR